MVRKKYVPDRGDVVWLDFDPVVGHEQKGRRPALVISPKLFNLSAHFSFVCPITSRRKGYPFEVPVSVGIIQGVILTDQLRSVDWTKRKVKKIGTTSPALLVAVQQKLKPLVF
jgi:mRNA interferase MazF